MLRHYRRELRITATQRDRVLQQLIARGMSVETSPANGSNDYSRAQTDLYVQMQRELMIRDRFAEWEETHRRRGTERRVDPLRPLSAQALDATIAVRWQFFANPPLSFRRRPRWEVEGILLDPRSERFLISLSQERISYRLRLMGVPA